MRTLGAIVVLVPALGCTEQVPLPHPINCARVLQVRIGMAPSDVHAIIGSPIYPNWTMNREQPPITRWERYAERPLPERVSYHDDLILGYADDKLVWAYAQRVGGHVVDPAGGNPRLAYRLSVTADGESVREFGPAFEEVFQCEPGFVRPTDD